MPLTMSQAQQLAKNYWEKYNLGGELDLESLRFSATYYKVEGAAWEMKILYPPSNFECLNEASIVISIEKQAVNHIINRFGYEKYPHKE